MANKISDLQAKFIDFAAGMPAVSISWRQVSRDVALLSKSLIGINPGQPSPFMGNIPMPLYRLAYSVFVDKLEVKPNGNVAELIVWLTANIHPLGKPDKVIRTYQIKTPGNPIATLTLDLDTNANELFWQQQGAIAPEILPAWGTDADANLALTTIPVPQRDTYIDEIERQVIWLTAPAFIKLVADALPRYRVTEIAPWLRFQAPIRVDLGHPHIVVTAARATLFVGGCSPETITIDPDPNFPYGEQIPAPTLRSDAIDMAVYGPRTRILDFYAKKIEPAILVSDAGGGVIKWSLAGSVGLKHVKIDLATAQGTTGILSIFASVDFVAGAQAWIDGPCGIRVSLASATLLGDGAFGADVYLTIDIAAGSIEAAVKITQSQINPQWDIHTPFGWPLDAIAAKIIDHVSQNEVGKFNGKVAKIGKWDLLGLPTKYLDTYLPHETAEPYSEGLAHVSMFTAVRRHKDG